MAIKSLMLRRKIDVAKTELEGLRAKDADLKKREDEVLAAIEEAKTEEERKAADEAIENLNSEQETHEQKKSDLEKTIADLEKDLAEEENRAKPVVKHERKVNIDMNRRFRDFNFEERSAFVARAEVKEFLQRVRELRGVTGTSVLIPDAVVELLREEVQANSKLIAKVNKKKVKGTSRQPVMGTVPEGIWVESTAAVKGLELGFSQVKVDGYKVGGYIAVANSTLEDSDIALANEIVSALGEAIAKALDKAILYGNESSMPLGVVTRLAQTSKPATYPADAPAWEDLHTSNITKFASASMTGEAFFKKLGEVFSSVSAKHAKNTPVWIMNHKTAVTVKTFGINFNAAGAIVSGINGQMPVFGGEIVELECVPNNDVIVGFFETYLLSERSGAAITHSEHAQFIEDNTVFKGVARYDGKPADAAAFAATNIANTAVTTTGFYTAETEATV